MPVQRGGYFTNSGLFGAMLSAFLRKAGIKRSLRRLQIAVAIPSFLGDGERLRMIRLVRSVIDAEVYPVDQALAAAIGAGLPVWDLKGCMIVNIGAGTTQIAVLSCGTVLRAYCLPLAGEDFDVAIAGRIESSHRLLIGGPTAERLKIRIGSAVDAAARESAPVMGRSVSRGVPQAGLVTAGQVHEAILSVLNFVGNAVQGALRATPPELLRHMADTGIVLTGGSASLHALDGFLSRRCGLPVRVADEPASCVVRGLGGYFEQPRALERRA